MRNCLSGSSFMPASGIEVARPPGQPPRRPLHGLAGRVPTTPSARPARAPPEPELARLAPPHPGNMLPGQLPASGCLSASGIVGKT
ncbi:hypothetical protein BLAT2472_80026 [Burkholderia latens]